MNFSELAGLLRGASFVFLCRVTGAVLTFLAQIVLARWMGAEQMGVYVFAFSVCILLTTISSLGLPNAAIRFIGAALAHDRGDLVMGFTRRSVQIIAVVGVAIAVLGSVLLLSIGGLVESERQAALLMALVIVPIYGQLNSRSGIAMGLAWFPTALLPNMVLRPLIFLLLIAGAWQFSVVLTAQSAMSLQLLAVSLMAILQWRRVTRRLRTGFPGAGVAFETSLWLRTAAPLLLISLSTNYFLELNVFFAGNFLAPGELAFYNASVRIAGLIAFGLIAVDSITMPKVSRLHAGMEVSALQSIVSHAARLRFAGSLVGLIVIVLFGRFLLALFGEDFVTGYQALVILAASYVASALFGPAARILSVTGLQDQCLLVFVVSLLAMLVLFPVLIWEWGINGAALAVSIITILQAIWLNALIVRRLGINAWIFAVRKIE